VRSRPRSSVDVGGPEASFNFAIGALKVVAIGPPVGVCRGSTVGSCGDYKTGPPRRTSSRRTDSMQLSLCMGAAAWDYQGQRARFYERETDEGSRDRPVAIATGARAGEKIPRKSAVWELSRTTPVSTSPVRALIKK